MELSALQIFNEILLVALCVAGAYIGAVMLISLVGQLLVRYRDVRSTVSRPGELVHQALKVTGRTWDQYRTALLLFGVSFLLLTYFGAHGRWAPNSIFLNILISLGLLAPVSYGALKLWQLARFRLGLSRLLDMHEQMAQRMIEVLVRGNRVYPSVKVQGRVIDNVVVGRNGIYALQLVIPPAGAESVRYERGALIFQPCGTRVSLSAYNKALQDLQSMIGEQINTECAPLPVLVVPECRIEPQEGQGPMLVSMQACTAFVSWQDNSFFLHDEDIAQIAGWLGKQNMITPPTTVRAAVNSLQGQIKWPALV